MRGQRRATRAVLPPRDPSQRQRALATRTRKAALASNLAKMIARAERGEPLFAERRES